MLDNIFDNLDFEQESVEESPEVPEETSSEKSKHDDTADQAVELAHMLFALHELHQHPGPLPLMHFLKDTDRTFFNDSKAGGANPDVIDLVDFL